MSPGGPSYWIGRTKCTKVEYDSASVIFNEKEERYSALRSQKREETLTKRLEAFAKDEVDWIVRRLREEANEEDLEMRMERERVTDPEWLALGLSTKLYLAERKLGAAFDRDEVTKQFKAEVQARKLKVGEWFAEQYAKVSQRQQEETNAFLSEFFASIVVEEAQDGGVEGVIRRATANGKTVPREFMWGMIHFDKKHTSTGYDYFCGSVPCTSELFYNNFYAMMLAK